MWLNSKKDIEASRVSGKPGTVDIFNLSNTTGSIGSEKEIRACCSDLETSFLDISFLDSWIVIRRSNSLSAELKILSYLLNRLTLVLLFCEEESSRNFSSTAGFSFVASCSSITVVEIPSEDNLSLSSVLFLDSSATRLLRSDFREPSCSSGVSVIRLRSEE